MSAPTGYLSLDQLRDAVADGHVDTVIVAFTDMQGRLVGKRVSARLFLEDVAAHGAECCNYLLAVDVEMNTVAGYSMSSWERGYGDMAMIPDFTTLRIAPWLEATALVTADLQITDQNNAVETPDPGTLQSFKFEFPVDCVATALTTIGSNCNLNTTADAVVPGSVTEGKRSIWQIGQVSVKDAGPNGTGYASCPPTCGDGDETTLLRQGMFVP